MTRCKAQICHFALSGHNRATEKVERKLNEVEGVLKQVSEGSSLTMPKGAGTKMESRRELVQMAWKEEASRMFFQGSAAVGDISAATGVSRQSVSAFLKQQPGYRAEKQRRKEVNAIRRREYKAAKNREYRSAARDEVTAETMKREHDMAAAILSREKYYG